MYTEIELHHAFSTKMLNNNFDIVRGDKTINLNDVVLKAERGWIVRPSNTDYAEREVQWYLSQSLNVNDIPGGAPKIWKEVATPEGIINSNYGWCIFSAENGKQYDCCVDSIARDLKTRRGVMIYTRPSMQTEYNKDGMNDFMCTHYVHVIYEDEHGFPKLLYLVYQRSCDAVFGYNNDWYWHKFVADKLSEELKSKKIIPSGTETEIRFHFGSVHVYERHFKYLEV